jgi:integrase
MVRVGEVFVPGGLPKITYNPRKDLKLEQRVRDYLDERHKILSLSGPTFASLMIDAGANPKVVQEYMGHSKIQTTFDTYGHLIEGSRDEVRRRMDAYLSEAPAATRESEQQTAPNRRSGAV